MRRVFAHRHFCLVFHAVACLSLARGVALADQYVWQGGSGDFTNGANWIDTSQPNLNPPPPPGAADFAEYPSGTINFSGNTTAFATVDGGVTFSLGGNYTATSGAILNGPLTLTGSGTFSANYLNEVGGPLTINAASIHIDTVANIGADLTASGGGTLSFGQLLVGKNASSTVSFSNVTVNSGSSGADLIAATAGANGTLTLDNSHWTTSNTVKVGYEGTGTLTISNGGQLTSGGPHGAGSAIGGNIDSDDSYHRGTGQVTVTGQGSAWTSSRGITVGVLGNGRIDITAGGVVTSPSAIVSDATDPITHALNPAGNATAVIDGNGSAWNLSDGMLVGNTGMGSLYVTNAAMLAATNQIVVGGQQPGNGNLVLQTGGVANTAVGIVAAAHGSAGQIFVDGAGSTLNVSNYLEIGRQGNGFLHVTHQGRVNSASALLATGFSAGGNNTTDNFGTVDIDGNGSLWNVTGDMNAGQHGTAQLTLTQGGSLTVGALLTLADQGTGMLAVQQTARATAGRAVLGAAAGSAGSATITDAGSLWQINGNLTIGQGGTGTVTVQQNGTLHVVGDLTLGENAGSTGTLTLDGFSSRLIYGGGGVSIGAAGAGMLEVRNGFNADLSGVDVTLGENAGGNGTLHVHDAGSTFASGGLTIGGAGVGTFNAASGATVNTSGDAAVADEAGGHGAAAVDAATWNIAGSLSVGSKGTGDLNIQNGGAVSVRGADLTIGEESTAAGTLSLTGKQSSLTFAGEMTVGKTGTGTFAVRSGATFNVGAMTLGKDFGSSGTLNVDGGGSGVSVAHDTTIGGSGSGALSLTNGAVLSSFGAASLADQAGSSAHATVDTLSAWTVSGDLSVGSQGAAQLTVQGGSSLAAQGSSVTIGEAGGNGTLLVKGTDPATSTPSTFSYRGELHVGDAGIGELDVKGGGIVQPATGGSGAVAVAVQPNSKGTIVVDGAASRLHAARLSIGGSTDKPGGAGQVTLTNGGELTASASVKLWANGAIDVTGGSATVGAASPAAVPGALRINSGGSLLGFGTVTGNVLNAGGVVAPGGDPGTLAIHGNFEQDAGLLPIHISAATSGSYDSLSVSGSATLGGSIEVDFVNGYAPKSGDAFTLIQSPGVTGAFGNVTIAGILNTWKYSLAAAAQGLVLESLGDGATTIPGDVNGDGSVGFDDLITLARNYGRSGTLAQGDLNNDGSIGFDDLVILARHYGQYLTAAQLGQFPPAFQADVERAFAQVPEPATAASLAIFGAALLLRCRRCGDTLWHSRPRLCSAVRRKSAI